MIKSLFAIAMLSGSLNGFAENIDHYNDSSLNKQTDTINQYNDTTATYPQHYNTGTSDSYEDSTSTGMSSTTTTDSKISPSNQYSDETSSSMSATGTAGAEDSSGSQYSSGSGYNSSSSAGTMNYDNTVSGTMGTGESITDRYNKLHVGLLGGVSDPNSSSTATSSEYGLEMGYQPTRILNVGAEVTTTKLDRSDEARRTMGLLKATTQLGDSIPVIKEIFVGAAGGTVVTDGKWRIGGGPLAGFDVPLSRNASHDFFTVGANAKYIFTNATPDSLIAALAVKYWF
jgi:hypothetical protein